MANEKTLEVADVARDTTLKELVEQLKYGNALKAAEVSESMNTMKSDIKWVLEMVRKGIAPAIFEIGDQLVTKWTDVTTNKTYDCPMNITKFHTATLQDGEQVPAMQVQWHYATPYGVQFNNYQAFYYATAELPAGTYYIEMGTSWGNCVSGKKYQFTLTKAVPAGGQLAGFREASDQAPSSWKVYAYASKTTADTQETVSVAEGCSGTKLGVLKFGGDGTLNCLQRVAYGYNRWGQSALRQWYNSDKGVGEWWTPQNDFDRPPEQLALKAGFLTGVESELKEILKPTKVVTALNTYDVTATSGTTLEETYDKFFPLSLEEMYIEPQLSGEGEYSEYWRRASQMTSKMKQYGTYPQIRTYAIESHTVAQTVRLRSALHGYQYDAWYVNASGYVYDYYAFLAIHSVPACNLC